MKVLITGATGFLGSHLVKSLLRAKHEVVILKRSFSNCSRIAELLPEAKVFNIDQCSLEAPFLDNKKIDTIIHTATSYGRKNEAATEVFETNTIFPLQLLEKAIFFKVHTFINTDTVLNKNINPYAMSKNQFREWGKYFAQQGLIHFVNVRLEHIYGPGDDESKFTTYIVRKCLENIPELNLTLGMQKRDFIYIDDAVSAFMVLINEVSKKKKHFLQYDLGSGQHIAIRNFVEKVHLLSGSKTKLQFGTVPYRKNEVMESKANIKPLNALGWINKTNLEEGIGAIIREEGK